MYWSILEKKWGRMAAKIARDEAKRLILFLKWAISGLLLFLSFQQLRGKMLIIKFCGWLDLNSRPLVLEATALPAVVQPLPYIWFKTVLIKKQIGRYLNFCIDIAGESSQQLDIHQSKKPTFWPHKKSLKELSLTDLKVDPFDLALVNHEALDQHVLFIE